MSFNMKLSSTTVLINYFISTYCIRIYMYYCIRICIVFEYCMYCIRMCMYWECTAFEYVLYSNTCMYCIRICIVFECVLYSNTCMYCIRICIVNMYCIRISNMYCIRIPVCTLFEYVLYSNTYCIRIQYVHTCTTTITSNMRSNSNSFMLNDVREYMLLHDPSVCVCVFMYGQVMESRWILKNKG